MPPDNDVERRMDTVRVLTQLQGGVKHCVEELAKNTKSIDRVFKVLQGNDGDGLITRMKVAEGGIGANAKAIEDHKGAHKWWRQSIAKIGMGITGTGLIAAIVYLIKTIT